MNDLNSKSFVYSLAALLIVVLTAVYWNHFDNGFHFDDSHTIVNNNYVAPRTDQPDSLQLSLTERILLIFSDAKTTSSLPTNQAYRPLVTSLNAIDFWIAGSLNPTVFHWHIYFEFILLLGLFYLLLAHVFKEIDGKDQRLLAMLAAAFFGFHTATAETINYIIARSDGVSTFLVLTSALIYIKNDGITKQLALIPFILGCLAKPTTLMLAPILFAYELLIVKPSFPVKTEDGKTLKKTLDVLKHTTSFFLVGAGMYLFTRSMFSDTWQPSTVNMWDYLNTQPYIFWVYIKTFFLPTELTADTDLTLIKEYFSPKILFGLLVIALSLAVAFRCAFQRKTLPIAFGIFWFYVALIPSSSVIPLAEVMNHHRTFFPYLGLVMAVFWAGYLLYERIINSQNQKIVRAVSAVFIVVVFSAHVYGTYQRNEVWHSDESLWYDVTIKSPKNGRGLMNYGLTEMRKGNMESAIKYFEKALNTSYGRHPYLYINLGIANNSLANRTNDPELKKKAETYLKQAIQMGPGYPDCHYHYAKWLIAEQRTDEAIKHLNRALELSPAHRDATILLSSLTKTAEQILAQAESNAVKQNTPEAFLDLSLKYYNHGQYENCIKACQKALRLRPEYAEAYNNICSAYNKLNLFEEAAKACESALQIKPEYELAKGNLNWARSQMQKGQ
ncbi:MAG: tetratricopeptide repeat protein [Flavobacteriales bacterium]|nr:tetratricopeptide repeat protein [Flavobacteriales bacterium]MCB9203362.1 tetratricopeptide repeat protein [Flavobacteriales bacterium]